MDAAQEALVERVRSLLAGAPGLREVAMFGGRAFMVDGAMVVSAGRDGSLLVRVAADRDEALLAEPGAERARMGKAGSMGVGWIDVGADAIADDHVLADWVRIARERER